MTEPGSHPIDATLGGSGGSHARAATFCDELADVEVVSHELLHRGYVWNVVSERFELGGETITREFVDHTGAVAVLALDDADRIMCIRQYRHPVGLRDWELPAGLLDQPGEDPLAAAKRELAEETDLVADEWWVLQDILTSPGGSSESIRVYLARGISASPDVFERQHEEAEIEPRWVPLDEAFAAVREGRVQNATTVTAVYAAHAARAAGWCGLRPSDAPWATRPVIGDDRA